MSLKQRRGAFKRSLTTFETFALRLTPGLTEEPPTDTEVKIRLTRLEKEFENFQNIQTEIEFACATEEEEDAEYKQRELLEEKVISIQVTLQRFLENSPQPQTVAPPSDSGSAALAKISEVLEHLSNQGQSNTSSSFQIPAVAVPSFDGDYKNWQSFHDLFSSLIHNNPKLTPSQKLQHTKGALKGEALSSLRQFNVSDVNYEPAWEELNRRFNKRHIIIQSHIQAIIDHPVSTNFSPTNIRNLANTTSESVCALNALKATSTWDNILIYIISNKLDTDSKLLWRRKTASLEEPTFDMLLKFLEERQLETEAISQKHIRPQQPQQRHQGKAQHGRSESASKSFHSQASTCPKCSATHPLYRCSQYKELSVPARQQLVDENQLCINCLRPGHIAAKCNSSYRCAECKQPHHTSLHAIQRPTSNINHIRLKQALLPTVILFIEDASKTMQPCRAFLDSGAEQSLVSEACIQRLGIRRQNAKVHIRGVDNSKMGTTRGSTKLKLKSRINPNFTMDIESLIVSNVTSDLPSTPISEKDYYTFKDLELADPDFYKPGRIDLLLSSDIFFAVIQTGKFTQNNLVALNTAFGWIIGGRNELCAERHITRTHHNVTDIDEQLRRFWEIEESPADTNNLTAEEVACETHFAETHVRDTDGRYTVRLPFNSSKDPIGESRQAALKQLFAVEHRLSRDENLRNQYVDFMNEYLHLGHMKAVRQPSPTNENFYLPHHAIIKETSSTTKLRVVFDASRKSSLGVSLNDKLMVGPTVQTDLLSLLIKFRIKPIAMCADIEKMYRQIQISDQDTRYQRILWRETPADPVEEFELTTVTYGTASAPYLATKTLQQLARDEQQNYPTAAKILQNDFYVDDLMSGAETPDEAIQNAAELTKLLKSGGFELRKWSSNSNQFLESIPSELIECSYPLQIIEDKTLKTLGLNWYPASDQFTFTVNLVPAKPNTKRTLLSDTARIFDPLGWAAPCIIIPKQMFQKLWTIGLGWDDPLPSDIQQTWQKFRAQLNILESFKIPRWISTTETSQIQLHGFCDASEAAYAAVVYSRIISKDGTVKTHLIAAKTKVAPVKQVSIPRLELCGAQLLAKLMNKIRVAFNKPDIECFAWTDSTIVLAWLAEVPRKWKTFVANRTSEILTQFPFKHWHHVKSGDNPADIASRGAMPADLLTNNLWWHGPHLLAVEPLNICNSHPSSNTEAMAEERTTKISTFVEIIPENDIITRYSSLKRLLRISAYCLRFAFNTRQPKDKRRTGFLSATEIQTASNRLVAATQQQHFAKEINQCLKLSHLSPSSKLVGLRPFVDNNNIVRVGGRLDAADIPYEAKHPAILPRHDHFTELVIRDIHIKNQHAGISLTLNILQQEFWIIGARQATKKLIHQCVTCRRHKGRTSQQLMGNLPPHRIIQARAFLKTGVDFAGPLWLKQHTGRNSKSIKAYVAVFVCFVTKAIHLEPVSDLSAEAFIAALKRFTSRRGLCSDIFSDNGSNFVAANKELFELQSLFNQENVANYLATNGIKWHFIPPSAPNFGGLWEAGVKSMKTHLKKVLGTTTLTFEALATLLCQIEASLNSRPLCPKTPDSLDVDPLTPGHFLIGDQLKAIPEPNMQHIPTNRLSHWQYLTKLHQHFWTKWHRDYLHQMQQRQKWSTEAPALSTGTIVTVKDDNLPPSKWILGRITTLHLGRDGLQRVATLRTQNGELKRPLSKLCVLLEI